jgi:hypothetical protein
MGIFEWQKLGQAHVQAATNGQKKTSITSFMTNLKNNNGEGNGDTFTAVSRL